MSTELLGLQEWAGQCAERHHRAYLLIDGALNDGQYRQLISMHIPYTSLFDDTPEQPLLAIAPWLIELTQLTPEQRMELLGWATTLARRQPCLSWFESACAPNAFAEHLRHFHSVALSDNQTLLMRWYDTRILPVWLEVLTRPQRQIFTSCMHHIACVDADGAVRVLHTSRSATHSSVAPSSPGPLLSLDDHQFGMLLEARALETLVHEIGLRAPAPWQEIPRARLLEFVAHHRDAAMQAGVEDPERQLYYLLLAVFTSGEATQHPAVRGLMQAPPASAPEFIEAVKRLPAEVFLSGPPLWVSEPLAPAPGASA